MKKIFTVVAAIMLSLSAFAQAPQKMSYQAVIRDGSNTLIVSTTVGVRISVLQGSSTGTPVYVETHTPTTNTNGLASFEIGAGTAVSGTFAGIDWSAGPYFIKTETDPTGGTTYTITGTSQLMSVPYALFAANGTPGPVGPTGANGNDGAAGATGATGNDGATGNTGPMGPMGMGMPGTPGMAGSTGVTGATGATGNNGADGSTGATGSNGTNGAAGATGIAGATGATGSNGTNGATGLTGTTGANGTNGATGIAGATGATGATGSNGTNGATGLTGTTGANGTNGTTGATGIAGATGSTGTIGSTGSTGATGTNGTNGATGATGIAGATGVTGSNGTNGTTGATGIAGTNGATGATGANGTNGATGIAGANGATGATGTNGTNGATGATGIAGTNGATGATGTNGTNGAIGATGANGASGATGATGPLIAGTIGQTLYHDNTTWVATSNLYNNGTNVGIGTTNPTRKFHLVDTIATNQPMAQFELTTTAATSTLPNSAIFGDVSGSGAGNVKGGYFSSRTSNASATAVGVFGQARNSGIRNSGVYGHVPTNGGVGLSMGVEGLSESTNSSFNFGFYGAGVAATAGSASAYGIYATAGNGSNVNATSFGIYASAPGSFGTRWSGWFEEGNFYVKNPSGFGTSVLPASTQLAIHTGSSQNYHLRLSTTLTGVTSTDGFAMGQASGGGEMLFNQYEANNVYFLYQSSNILQYNGVGVGIKTTASPTEALEVNGNVEIPAANTYKYSAAKTQYTNVPSAEFNYRIIGNTTTSYMESFTSGTASWVRGNGTTAAYLFAPVHVPNGAVITLIEVFCWDNDATYNVSADLMRQIAGSSASGSISFTANTSGASAAVQTLSMAPLTTVDNQSANYYLRFNTVEGVNNNLRLYGVRITYTVTSAD